MATPTLLGTPASMIFLSGSPAEQPEKSTIHTLISTLGRVEYLGSDPGAAAILDISLLTSMYGMVSLKSFHLSKALLQYEPPLKLFAQYRTCGRTFSN